MDIVSAPQGNTINFLEDPEALRVGQEATIIIKVRHRGQYYHHIGFSLLSAYRSNGPPIPSNTIVDAFLKK
jgi:hypothetical protein